MKERKNKMILNEVVFDTDYCDDSPNLNLIDEFFETNNEPTTTGRIYKGAGGGYPREMYPHSFPLRELPLDEIVHEDENYLVGYEPDCSTHMFKRMSTYKPVDKTRKRFKNLMIYEA